MRTGLTLLVGMSLALAATPAWAQSPEPSAWPSASPESQVAASAGPSVSPEASPQSACVPVDPSTLPRGVEDFEQAVSRLEADVAALIERAQSEGAKPEASTAIMDALWMRGQDFARAVNKADYSRAVRKAAEAVGLAVADETLLVATGYAGQSLVPVPDALMLPDSHAAIEGFRAEVGYSWPCEPEPGAVAASPVASPEAAVAVTPLETTTGSFAPETLFSGGLKEIGPRQVRDIIGRSAKAIAQYTRERFNPRYTTQDAIKFLSGLFREFMSESSFEVNGYIIARQTANMIYDANKMMSKGYEKSAKAYLEVAGAFYRRGYTILRNDRGGQVDPATYNESIVRAYEALLAEKQ